MPKAMPRPQRKKLGETLVEAGLIDDLQLRSALADQKRWGNRLGKTLVKLGFVEEEPLMRQLSRLMGYPLAEIGGRDVDVEVLSLLPGDVAEKNRCLPLFLEDDGAARYLYLGMEEPADLDTLDALQLRTGLEICPVLIGFRELDAGLRRFYGFGADDRAEDDHVPTGELVGPDCLRHGDEVLGGTDETLGGGDEELGWDADAGLAVDPAPVIDPPPEPMPDLEESFEVGVNASEAPGVEAPAIPAKPAGEIPPVSAKRTGDVPTRRILKALTQVLTEKGILTRDELVAAVQALSERDDG
jgi:type IV pilus assembly protein PilB